MPPTKHRHDEFHRGYVPQAQIASGTATVGYLPAATSGGTAVWTAPGSLGGGPFVNVKTDFGAVGDDTTDDTAAIQAAFDAYPAGATIFFPPGTYKITSAITITGKNFLILGAGDEYGPSVIKQHTTNTGGFYFNYTSYSGLRTEVSLVRGLLMQGPATGTSPATSSTGFGIKTESDVNLDHVGFSGWYYGLWWQNATFYSKAYGCFFSNCVRGIELDFCNNCTIDTCRITGKFTGAVSPCDELGVGVYINGGLINRVINCSVEYTTLFGIEALSCTTVEILGNYFESDNGSVDSSRSHIFIDSTTAALVSANYLQAGSRLGWMVRITGTTGCMVESNEIQAGSLGSITTGTGVTGVLAGNHATSTKTLSTGTLDLDNFTPFGGFATPAIVLGTAAAGGAATTGIRSDATIVAFDVTAPVTQALGDSAATGSAAVSARRDHKHGMPALSTATPVADSGAGAVGTGTLSSREDHVHPASPSTGELLISDTPSTPLVFADILQNEAQTDLVYAG